MSYLEINKLYRSFGGLQAVFDVSFTVDKGTINAIIGPNGAGKTTLINLISGALPPDSGDILFNGRHIENLPPYSIAKKGISRTFQNIKLFPNMSVLENIMMGRHIRSNAGFLTGMLNLPWSWNEESHILNKSREIINAFKLDSFSDKPSDSLPFGKQRILEFARAMAMEPELLILDEPAAGLNMHETEELAGVITKIKNMGITILLIEHDMSLVMDISDNIIVLNYGEKIAEGTPAEIQKNSDVIKIYLGEDNVEG
jgi:branched-chain amino acid transport system ATP-binding protein